MTTREVFSESTEVVSVTARKSNFAKMPSVIGSAPDIPGIKHVFGVPSKMFKRLIKTNVAQNEENIGRERERERKSLHTQTSPKNNINKKIIKNIILNFNV